MIRRIQALNYRSLRSIDQTLGEFHVLVGPNASGKSTFLDVISFLGDFVSGGLDYAIDKKRSKNFKDLFWGRTGDRFELAVEAVVPDEHRATLIRPELETIRYQVAIGPDEQSGELCMLAEWLLLKPMQDRSSAPDADSGARSTLFGDLKDWPGSHLIAALDRTTGEWSLTLENPSRFPDRHSWSYYHAPRNAKTSVFNLLRGDDQYPVSMWLGNVLREGIRRIELQSQPLRQASPVARTRPFWRRTDRTCPGSLRSFKSKAQRVLRIGWRICVRRSPTSKGSVSGTVPTGTNAT